MRGSSEIPDLKLKRLQGLITKFTADPTLKLRTWFPSSNADSDTIEWESQTGTRGLAPFKAPGGKTHKTKPLGIASHEAHAAFWGEKMFFDENFLNNLRQPGTREKHQDAKTTLATNLRGLRNRVDRREEWMWAKMLTAGSFSYLTKGSTKVSVDYGIPSDQIVTLTTNYKWGTGNTKAILSDLRDGKEKLQDSVGAEKFTAITTQTVLRYMVEDTGITNLFQKSQFGQGDLFGKDASNVLGIRPEVLGSILDIDEIVIINEKYTIESMLTAAVVTDTTVAISVANAADFEIGGTLRFIDISEGTYEEETISGVDVEAGTVTVDTAPSTGYKAGEDIVTMTKYYMDTDLFVLMSRTVEGMPIAGMKRSPFGLDRHYGLKLDKWDVREPDGTYIRAENKGLPVLYHKDAIYIIDVQ